MPEHTCFVPSIRDPVPPEFVANSLARGGAWRAHSSTAPFVDDVALPSTRHRVFTIPSPSSHIHKHAQQLEISSKQKLSQ